MERKTTISKLRRAIAGTVAASAALLVGAAELPPFSLPGTTSWLRDSASRGEAGTAVVVGDVDIAIGLAVFWNLAAVRPGAEVDVTRLDGRPRSSLWTRCGPIPGRPFRPSRSTAWGTGAELRVITCGGGSDRLQHEYTGNVVLFAHLSAMR
jgi:hypothetical protein